MILVKKKIIIIVITILLFPLFVIGGYAGFLQANYYRIEENKEIEMARNAIKQLEIGQTFEIATYNIGFGAYDQAFSFFMDTGYMEDGTKTKGKLSRARSKEAVLTNTQGSIDNMKEQNLDFLLLQEVDLASHRSYFVNQQAFFLNAFEEYDNSFANNFHSKYLFYPLHKPHGAVQSGISTFSRYQIQDSIRKSLPVSKAFVTKFFDLDRCMNIMRFPLGEKEFVLMNVHLSAYDEGGTIRKQQIAYLNQILRIEKEKGNYVVVGGDFNHDLKETMNYFPSKQKTPDWVFSLSNDDFVEGYSIVAANNAPTCRGSDIPYEVGVNYGVVIDGFIVSDNVEVMSITNLDLQFMYSDHNPVKMEFKFK